MYCADVCVTGAPAWHMVSLSEPCLLRHPTCLMFINLAKNDAGTKNFTTRESKAGVKCRAIEDFDDSASHTVRI